MRVSRPKTRTAERKFRELIWLRDQGRSRATGQPLERQSDNWGKQGDVCHLQAKGLHPERKYDTSNAFLMERILHIASDGRGHYRLKISGNADAELIFVMTDKNGQELWRRTSTPP
jgi:hypothetical protein